MAKQYFKLTGYYENLTAKRIDQSGRLWLVRVVSDPDKREGGTFKPYWFVMIRNFDLRKDSASGAKYMGVWRFGYEDEARAKFESLRPLYPPYAIKEPTERQLAARKRFAEMSRAAAAA